MLVTSGTTRRRRSLLLCACAAATSGAVLVGCGSTPAPGTGPTDESGRWVRVADSPLTAREYPTAVWTGAEVLVFGGDASPCPPNASCVAPTDPPPTDTAAYDPVTDSWRRTADLPEPLNVASAVRGRGNTIYVLGFRPGERDRAGDLAFLRFDPARDKWTELAAPDASLPGGVEGLSGLTAVRDKVLAYTRSHEGGRTPDLVFDPDAGKWAALPPSPLGDGFDRRIVGIDDHRAALLDLPLVPDPGAGTTPSLYRAAILDVDTMGWTRLPDSQVLGSDPTWLPVSGRLVNPTDGTSDGGGDYDRAYSAGGILDPEATSPDRTWVPLPKRPVRGDVLHGIGGGIGPVAGDGVVVSGGWVFHVRSGRWQPLPGQPSLQQRQGVASVWAGDRLFAWGGATFGADHPGGTLMTDGYTWRPATVRTTDGGTSSPAPSSSGRRRHGGGAEPPWQLVGSWLLDVRGEKTGTVLRLDVADLTLWRDCGVLEGTWRADSTGLFVGHTFAGLQECGSDPTLDTPGWLAATVGFRVTGPTRQLLGADGKVVATLRPGGRPTAGPNMLPSLADPPAITAATRAAFPEPAPLPSGLLPATAGDITGTWLPADSATPVNGLGEPQQRPQLVIEPDGSWTGSDGCNGSGGRWIAGDDGRILATIGASTLIGCSNIPVGSWFAEATRLGFTPDGDLVLVGPDGTELGRLHYP